MCARRGRLPGVNTPAVLVPHQRARYNFVLLDLGGGIRALRDPDAEDDEFGD
jgi:hypothetical protein